VILLQFVYLFDQYVILVQESQGGQGNESVGRFPLLLGFYNNAHDTAWSILQGRPALCGILQTEENSFL